MRQDFHDIVGGWTLVSGMADITDRIERAAKWAETNGPLQPDEEATIRLMIQTQIARGIEEGQVAAHLFSVEECPACGSTLPSIPMDDYPGDFEEKQLPAGHVCPNDPHFFHPEMP